NLPIPAADLRRAIRSRSGRNGADSPSPAPTALSTRRVLPSRRTRLPIERKIAPPFAPVANQESMHDPLPVPCPPRSPPNASRSAAAAAALGMSRGPHGADVGLVGGREFAPGGRRDRGPATRGQPAHDGRAGDHLLRLDGRLPELGSVRRAGGPAAGFRA